ncbi:MAG: GDSL-type esterase/lipase family protein [Phycisphaerales bacterium]
MSGALPPSTPDPGPLPPPTVPSPSAPRRRGRRWAIWLLSIAACLVVTAELVARFVLRLGDPPLYMADETIEYRMVPSRTYHRFYAVSTYNQWSMRSPEFGQKKADPREFRILVIGDSVVNGGPQTDQSQLATELMGPNLSATMGRPVVIANISCGSWGPPNMQAYLEKFGTFEADVAVIVLNHEDAADVPTFTPLTADFPTRTPILALEEALFRYIPLYFSSRSSAASTPALTRTPENLERDTRIALDSLRAIIDRLRAANIKVAVVLHAAQTELKTDPLPGTKRLSATLRELGVPTINDTQAMLAATTAGQSPYRDDIHLLPAGQAVLSRQILDAIQAAR